MKSVTRLDVDAGRGDVRADPVDQERKQREQSFRCSSPSMPQSRDLGARSLTPRPSRPPPRSWPARRRGEPDATARCRPGRHRRSPAASPGTSRLEISPAAKSVSGLTSWPVSFVEILQVDRLRVHLERIGEPALRQPPVHRHLAAFEAGVGLTRRCGPCDPCGPCPRSCPCPEPGPRPTRILRLGRAPGRAQRGQGDRGSSSWSLVSPFTSPGPASPRRGDAP